MHRTRRVIGIIAAVVSFIAVITAQADAQVCFPNFGYGNVGYSAGYSFSQAGWCGPRFGWCGPRWGGWCGPRWGGWCGPGWGFRPWGWRRWCAPAVAPYGYGWPAWYGSTWYPSCGSVWMGTPGGGSLFSGSVVPVPTIGWPLIAPGFVSTNTAAPATAALASARPASAVPPVAQTMLATIRDMRARREATMAAGVPRASNAVGRLRAARLVAVGDRHMRDAGGDAAKFRLAADAYRRAAAIAADQPDTFVRQALALVASGDRVAADAALARAAAIDGRLAAAVSGPAATVGDPVFGDRPAGSVPPVVARGRFILRQIAGPAAGQAGAGGEDFSAVATAAARWAERWGERIGGAESLVARR